MCGLVRACVNIAVFFVLLACNFHTESGGHRITTRDVNKDGSFKAKAKAKAKSLKAKAKANARSLKAKTKAKARDQG